MGVALALLIGDRARLVLQPLQARLDRAASRLALLEQLRVIDGQPQPANQRLERDPLHDQGDQDHSEGDEDDQRTP